MTSEQPSTQQSGASPSGHSEAALTAFVDTIPTLAWIANADGWITWYNRRWYEYTGTTPQQMEGWGWQSVHDPEQLPDVLERWTGSIRTGQPFEMVFPLLGSDGVFRSFLTRIVPVRNDAGELTNWFGTNTEVDELQRTRDALQTSEAQFRQIAESLPQLVWVTRPNGYYEWCNQRWYDYTGLTPGQCVGMEARRTLHPEDQPGADLLWQHSLASGEPYTAEYRCRRHDGEFRWFLGSALPLRSPEGEILRWFGTCTDIHRQKQAEAEAAAAQERIRIALKNVPLILSTADRDLRYTWIHRSHQKFNADEIIGRRDDEIEESPTMQQLVEMKRFVLEHDIADRREMRFIIKGVPEVYDITVEPLHDSDGNVAGVTTAALDITERANAEQDLREKSELIDLAQNAVNAGYWSYYPTTGECFVSPGEAVLFGLGGNARPSVQQVLERIDPEDREMVQNALRRGMETGFYFAEFRVTQQDGSTRWLAGQGRVLTRDDGERYMVGINLDTTNQKMAVEALRKSEKLAVAGRLAATISHEINNPLEAVTNLLYLLRTGTTDPETRAYAAAAEEELARVTQIVTHSLRFHRQSTHPLDETMSNVLDSAAGVYKSRLIVDHVEIRRDYRDSNPVFCYSSELRQVFGNFIGNAFDAIRQGGIIVLRTRNARDPVTGERGIRVTVADSGHGMDRQTLAKIFEPFFTTKGLNGTGLGLWISRDILKKHHGTLHVKSRRGSPNSGTVFSVFLPLAAIRPDHSPKAVPELAGISAFLSSS